MTQAAPQWPLALARAGVGLATIMAGVDVYGTLLVVADGRLTMPLTASLPPVNETIALLLLAVVMVAAVSVTLGVAARSAAFVACLSIVFAFAWEQQTYSNHTALCAWLCLWIALSPTVSRARLRGGPEPDNAVVSDQLPLMTQLSVCYLFAAVAKLNPDFLSGDVLRQFLTVDLPIDALRLLAATTVVAELFLAFGLWFTDTRWFAAAVGIGLHLMIPVTMDDKFGLVCFSLACVSLYPMFLWRPSLRDLLRNRDALHGRRMTAEPEL